MLFVISIHTSVQYETCKMFYDNFLTSRALEKQPILINSVEIGIRGSRIINPTLVYFVQLRKTLHARSAYSSAI